MVKCILSFTNKTWEVITFLFVRSFQMRNLRLFSERECRKQKMFLKRKDNIKNRGLEDSMLRCISIIENFRWHESKKPARIARKQTFSNINREIMSYGCESSSTLKLVKSRYQRGNLVRTIVMNFLEKRDRKFTLRLWKKKWLRPRYQVRSDEIAD